MFKKLPNIIIKASYILLFSFVVNPIYSQTDTAVERATRETDRLSNKDFIEEKLRPALPEKPVIQEKAEAPKEVAAEEKFFIKKINLVGCESFPPEVFSFLTAKYLEQELSLTDLNKLAKEIEQEYLKRGVIAAVFVPPQEIKEQEVILQIVEAKMGELYIQQHRYFAKQRLRYYWKLYQGEILRYDKLSKSIQLMNKNPDRQVKVALAAGKKPGTTDVVLTPQTRFPIHLTGSYDNEGSASTGMGRIGYGIRDNNFLGLDDTVLVGYSFGNYFNGIYAYHTVPITGDGMSLLYGYSNSQSKPTKEYVSTGLKSESKTVSVSLHQDIYKKDLYLGEVFAGFDAKDKTVKVSTGPINRDRLRVLSLGGTLTLREAGSTTSISPTFEQGVSFFGSSPSCNALASRETKPRFSKFNLTIQHRRALPFNLQANLKFKTQIASARLAPQEEYSLGGIDSVRGYPSGDYLADSAFNNSAELLMPSLFIPRSWRLPYARESLRDQTTVAAFLDYGWGMRRSPPETDKQSVTLLGAGLGLRINFFDQALLRLEWGFPLADNHPVSETASSRFHFSVDMQEKLPEEIERIKKAVEEENLKQLAWQLVNQELSRLDNPARKKMERYMAQAEELYGQGKLDEARAFYSQVVITGNSIYRQAEDYVRGCFDQEKQLQEYKESAIANHKQGNLEQARQVWQKIIEDAQEKTFSLEF